MMLTKVVLKVCGEVKNGETEPCVLGTWNLWKESQGQGNK